MRTSTLSPAEYHYMLRNDFLTFAVRAHFELEPPSSEKPLYVGPHIEVMASRLEALRRGDIKRLCINVPPRHLKSHLASIAFPAWFLGHNPSGKIAVVCYGQELSERFARECRRLMMSEFYQTIFGTRLAREAVDDLETTEGGVRFATSVGGPFTGRGADIIIVDDPTKPDDMFSESRRSAANMWFDNTARSRLDDKLRGRIAIVMQRQHQDDLVGHVLQTENWELVTFPAIAIADEAHVFETIFGKRIFRRKAGEALHPEREPLWRLEAERKRMGEFTFNAQYQQNPIPLEGAIVKAEWLRYYKVGEQPGRFDRHVLSIDSANKAGELNDYSVCTIWGVKDKYIYLLDVFRARLTYPDLKRKVVELAGRYPNPEIVIEDKASGTQLIQDLQHEIYGVKGYEPPASMDKEVRLRVQTTVFAQGFVLLPDAAPWLAEYVLELTGFPGTRYDDQVDSTTQALAHIRVNDSLAVWRKLGEGLPSSSLLDLPYGFGWGGPRFQ